MEDRRHEMARMTMTLCVTPSLFETFLTPTPTHMQHVLTTTCVQMNQKAQTTNRKAYELWQFRWPWVTFKVIDILQSFSSGIFSYRYAAVDDISSDMHVYQPCDYRVPMLRFTSRCVGRQDATSHYICPFRRSLSIQGSVVADKPAPRAV